MSKQAKLLNQIAVIRVMLDNLEDEIGGDLTCKHEHKKDLTTMGNSEEWICEDCGFHFKDGE